MKTLVVELHGFRRDYIREDTTPFLFSLVKKWSLIDLKPTFGPHVYPSTLTGVYPNKHHHLFKFSLKNTKKINFRRIIPLHLYNVLMNIFRFIKGYTFLTTLPYDVRVGKFDIDKNHNNFHRNAFRVKSLFDVLRQKQISFFPCSKLSLYSLYYILFSFLYKNSLKNDEIMTDIFINRMKKNKEEFFFHILLSADTYGHRYGPKSKEIKIVSKKIDDYVKKIVDNCNKKDCDVLIFANYGMLEVKKNIDLESKLPEWGKGYYYFLDSNYARFWFLDENVRFKVVEVLNNVKNGHVITKREEKEFHIDFDYSKFGEIIFIVDPHCAIYPNFFDKKPPRGLHSYDLKNIDEWGFILSSRSIRNKAEIVDITPTVFDMVAIDYSKVRFDGKSLLVG